MENISIFFYIFLAKVFTKRIIFHRDILHINLCNRSFKNLKLKESLTIFFDKKNFCTFFANSINTCVIKAMKIQFLMKVLYYKLHYNRLYICIWNNIFLTINIISIPIEGIKSIFF